MRDRLITGLLERVPHSWLNGHATQRLPNNVNLGFAGIEGESMLLLLDQAGIAASSGAACSAGSLEASHVLLALGLDERRALGSLRLSVGRATSADDVQYVLEQVPPIVARLRSFSA
jgi:cysteine desulfurase